MGVDAACFPRCIGPREALHHALGIPRAAGLGERDGRAVLPARELRSRVLAGTLGGRVGGWSVTGHPSPNESNWCDVGEAGLGSSQLLATQRDALGRARPAITFVAVRLLSRLLPALPLLSLLSPVGRESNESKVVGATK